MTRRATLTLLLTLSLVLTTGYALAAAPWQHQAAWTEAVETGLIQGDPAYYHQGEASQDEINHALLTAILQVNTEQWVPPIPGATLDDPGSFCAEEMWEYRYDGSGQGYWPQIFADTWTYDSLTLFDDVYGPVTYLNPRPDHLYQHPAGGYTAIIICMAKS